jgi:hypothetical protein
MHAQPQSLTLAAASQHSLTICFFADTRKSPSSMSRRAQSTTRSAAWVLPRRRCVGLWAISPKSSWSRVRTTSGMIAPYSIFLPIESNGLRTSGRSCAVSSRTVTLSSARLALKVLRNAADWKSCAMTPNHFTVSLARVSARLRVPKKCTTHRLEPLSNSSTAIAGLAKASQRWFFDLR